MAVPLSDRLDLRREVLVLLASDEPRSSHALARHLHATQAQVDAAIAQLRALGLAIAASPDGLRLGLSGPLDLLDTEAIRAELRPQTAARLHRLEVLFEVDSTNTRLLSWAPPSSGEAHVALAELQRAGRGRQGRRWITPFGASLALSLAWTFPDAGRVDSTLSLAVGVAVVRALARRGARGISLKWPNDVWLEDRKLGGVLVETKLCGRAAHVVIGVGLNVSLSDETRREIGCEQPASLAEACEAPVARNPLAAALLEELLSMLPLFERGGFGPFREEWSSLDALRDRPARVLLGASAVAGIARGVAEDGGLLLEHGGHIDKFISGEASLRLMAGDA